MPSFCSSCRKVRNIRSRRCEHHVCVVSNSIFKNTLGAPFLFQGNEEETLNILRRIYKINNPRSEADYNVTKVVEDLEFIDNDTREISNVSKNPFVMLWKQTCLLFSKKNGGKTVLICLMQVSALGQRVGENVRK